MPTSRSVKLSLSVSATMYAAENIASISWSTLFSSATLGRSNQPAECARSQSCPISGEDSMTDELPARVVKWPTDEEVKAEFEAYTNAVGKVAHASNYFHERLGRLF